MRALIDAEFHDGDIAPVVAARIVAKLSATDPELLAGWLQLQAVAMLTEAIGAIDRSARTHARAVASRGAFSDAATAGDVSGFLATRFVVDEQNTRMALAGMKAEHLRFVAARYSDTAKSARMEAAFFRALAKKVGAGSVGDHFTNAAVDELRRSIVGSAA
jgi:hypothetical protein